MDPSGPNADELSQVIPSLEYVDLYIPWKVHLDSDHAMVRTGRRHVLSLTPLLQDPT